MATAAPDYASSALKVFLEADQKTQKRLALEAFREGNKLLSDLALWDDYIDGDSPWIETLKDMTWLWELAIVSTELRALMTTKHLDPEHGGPALWTSGHDAALLLGDAFDLTDSGDSELYARFIQLENQVLMACAASIDVEPHPASHKPLMTLEGLDSQTALRVMAYAVRELGGLDADAARYLASTEWVDQNKDNALRIYNDAFHSLLGEDVLQYLEHFARKYAWSEKSEADYRAAYAGTCLVNPGMIFSDDEWLEPRQAGVLGVVSTAISPLLLEEWWQTIQKNEPYRLTKDLLAAFVGNENTPEAIRDEAQVELDFYFD